MRLIRLVSLAVAALLLATAFFVDIPARAEQPYVIGVDLTNQIVTVYKAADGTRDFVHTISATAMTDRAIIAILENNQRADGSVVIPEVLRPFTGFDVIEPKKA